MSCFFLTKEYLWLSSILWLNTHYLSIAFHGLSSCGKNNISHFDFLVTPRGALCKQEKIGNSNSSKEESRGKHISLRKKRKINLEEVYSLEAGKTLLDNSPVHDDYMSPEGAHFKPKSLSANALKHLQESPVLHSSCPQSTDSRTRKWSDRKSPLSTCKRSFRKRLRHDS